MGCCEHGNKPLVSIKGGKFVDELSYYCPLKKDSASVTYLFS
jgi:hypothetical protein